jgi:hypothetical protein
MLTVPPKVSPSQQVYIAGIFWNNSGCVLDHFAACFGVMLYVVNTIRLQFGACQNALLFFLCLKFYLLVDTTYCGSYYVNRYICTCKRLYCWIILKCDRLNVLQCSTLQHFICCSIICTKIILVAYRDHDSNL